MPKIVKPIEPDSDFSSVSDMTDDPEQSAPPPPVKGLERLTISDDRSAGSDLEARYLMALKDRTAPSKAPESVPPVPVAISRPSDSDQGVERTRLQQRFGRLEFDAAIVSSTIPSGRQDSSVNATARGNLTKGMLESDTNEQPASADNHVRLEGRFATDMGDQSDSNSKLDAGIESLQERIRNLQDEVDQLEIQKRKTSPKAYCILYRIQKEIYFDHPEWTDGNKAIVSRAPVKNLDLFLEKNKNVTFIIYRDFKGDPSSVKKSKLPQPKHTEESIRPVNKQLRKGIETFLQNNWRYKMILQAFYKTGEVQAPYFFIYHDRSYWASVLLDSTKRLRGHPAIVARYVLQNYGSEYAAADALFARGRISVNFVKYLCQPGDILVSRIGDQYRGLVATSWPLESGNSERRGKGDVLEPGPDDDRDTQWSHSGSDWNSESIEAEFYSFSKYDLGSILASDAVKDPTRRSSTTTLASMRFEIWVWEWGFDGAFKRVSEEVVLRLAQKTAKVALEDTEFNLCDLNVFPLRFASKSIVEGLRRRGEMFWGCRKRCLVSYQEPSTEEQEEMSDERFMIDFLTFRKLHPENLSQTIRYPEETMSQAEMDEEQPPDEAFFYLVPLQTKGFNLRTKKWLDLNMDQIHPVVWNRKAFDTLVLDRKTKELITALVSKQISATKSTDVIAGKGNGLILLLHGGPGTGKTLTAEGVAEIAKKPLYRVTCGDVGTKAEEVESYLESVLHLGKIWDCVVLLDEAEVFLERRSLDDLQRNALVSVFLRVIEYHEGILILTSNRVGTFDEAFRSRIQIAVHYPPLRAYQRLQIWKNFFDRLESFKDGTVDVDELRDHLEDLQNIEINGRQIRNAITTARQYADWKDKVMNYEHLTTALEVAGKFDAYSEKLRGGLTDDQIAEEEGIR